VNDGWTDLADNYRLDWQYEEALDGNIAPNVDHRNSAILTAFIYLRPDARGPVELPQHR
jgi:hypothetical protein